MFLILKHWITSFFTAQDLLIEIQNFLLKIESIIPNIFKKCNISITSILVFSRFSSELNTNILSSSIDYILSTKVFIIFVFQLNRFFFLVLFYPHFNFFFIHFPGIQKFIMPGYCHFYVLCVCFFVYTVYKEEHECKWLNYLEKCSSSTVTNYH